ncbi:acyltransferase [Pullulanibacillus sp. KACC 23026]|uniref:acyltransferase family protein n=1 Tax=Pullulanibacillus sp. KACC 23026 TaxID=3028315 RepID=UPI0023AF4437|nr:acyltransferase [Pullulanibacillus sp. KACC 23026]WEG14746.1 acyltransferase [Pullulanibacillus sp. KACC 23026]
MKINKVQPYSDASGLLDLLRFLSALTVLELHATLKHVIPGYQAVMVFFVLSGYFVGSGVLKNVLQQSWSWSQYLINRFVRLWIVLLPSLCLTIIWVKLQNAMTDQTIHNDSLKSFMINALFLKGQFTPSFGQNGVLWSLTYEFWYYILFPPLALFLFSKSIRKRFLYFVVTVALAYFIYQVLGPRVLKYFSIWLMGAGVAILPRLKWESKRLNRVVMVLASAAAIGSLWLPDALLHYTPTSNVNAEPFIPDLIIGLSYSLLIYTIISFYKNTTFLTGLTRTATFLAGFSYTLYLIHFPVFNFIRASHKDHAVPLLEHFQPSQNLRDNIVLVILMIVYAWVISRLTEEHTPKIRRMIQKLISYPRTVLWRVSTKSEKGYD